MNLIKFYVDNEIKNNSVNIIFACEKDYGKYEGLIGKCDLNNIEFIIGCNSAAKPFLVISFSPIIRATSISIDYASGIGRRNDANSSSDSFRPARSLASSIQQQDHFQDA